MWASPFTAAGPNAAANVSLSSWPSAMIFFALATAARPKKLVLYHQLTWGATTYDDLVAEIREAGYEGDVVSGQDLDVF